MAKVLAGRYRLVGELGHGGMGTVWRGHDDLLDREVAIKEVSGGDLLIRRSQREARLAARLHHPNIAAVYDLVREDGRLWIVMQLIRARSLGEVITQDGPLSPREAAKVGLDVLAALEAAHRAGVVHRDVKPDNIMLPEGGGAVLTDFGIAAALGDDSGMMTRTDVVLGTPAFIAPERAMGGDSGPAADLWSLGVTLYTAVEGRAPFSRGNGMATLYAVVHEEPRPFDRAGALSAAISALLSKDPAARPGIAEARDLLLRARSLRDAPVVTGPAGRIEWPRGRALHVAASILVLVAACGAAAAMSDERGARSPATVHQAAAPPTFSDRSDPVGQLQLVRNTRSTSVVTTSRGERSVSSRPTPARKAPKSNTRSASTASNDSSKSHQKGHGKGQKNGHGKGHSKGKGKGKKG